jgi:hypothetical protein
LSRNVLSSQRLAGKQCLRLSKICGILFS